MDGLRDGWKEEQREKWVTSIRLTTALRNDGVRKEGALGRNRLKKQSGWIECGQAPCCSLGLGVYGNGSKHDISPAASGMTPASNDSPAAQ